MAALRNKFKIKLDGAPLNAEVEKQLISALVEDSRNAPDLFVLTLLDPERRSGKSVLEKMRGRIGSQVEISVVSGDTSAGETIFKGEVTALEVEFDPNGTHSIIRGFDPSHRLFRGRKTKAWTNKSYSDIATKVAGAAGLTVGKVDPTTPVYDHVPQFNESDWAFVRRLGAHSNREVVVGDGRFEFRKSTPASQAPGVANLAGRATPLQLKLSDLISFHAVISAADQVKEVQVKGWDYENKQEVVGTAKAKTSTAKIGTTPEELAQKFGSPVFVEVESPSGDQKHLNNLAESLAEQIASGFFEIQIEVHGNTKLRAGTPISFAGAGKPFDGQGTISTSQHLFEPNQGYRTFCFITGRQDRSFFAMTSGARSNGSGAAFGGRRIEGVVPAIVTDNKDPKKLGRVKVKFPWADANYVSHWARCVQPGAGEERGWMILPEVKDEVVVAFEQGDVRYPVVIGGVYNGKQKPYAGKVPLVDDYGEVNKRMFVSRTGHLIAFVESKDSTGISIKTSNKKQLVMLDMTKNQIVIKSDGLVKLEAKEVQISADSDITIEASKNLELKAQATLDLKAGGPVNIKGATVNLNPPGG